MKLALASLLGLVLIGGPPGDPIKVDFEVLSGFDYTEGMELPAEVTAYDEKKVTVAGFMRKENDGDPDDVEYFMIVNDACGCEGEPKLNEVVFCAMPEGQTTEIFSGIVEVTGKLFVGEDKDEGVVLSLYTMDVESIKAN